MQEEPRLVWLAAGAAAYAAVRFVEACGLLRERAWAEWLAALSGAVYLPLEFAKLLRTPSMLGAAVLLANLAVVAIMARALRHRQKTLPDPDDALATKANGPALLPPKIRRPIAHRLPQKGGCKSAWHQEKFGKQPTRGG